MTRFPTGEGGWQVSRGGGEGPVRPSEVDELVFLGGTPAGPRSLMAAPIRLGPEVVIGAPLKLFEIAPDLTGELGVARDSKQFVMIRQGDKSWRPTGTLGARAELAGGSRTDALNSAVKAANFNGRWSRDGSVLITDYAIYKSPLHGNRSADAACASMKQGISGLLTLLLVEGLLATVLITGPITFGIYEMTGGAHEDPGRQLIIAYVFGVVLAAFVTAVKRAEKR